MICRESLEYVVRGYFLDADEQKVAYITNMIACRLEILAYDIIRQSYAIDKNRCPK